MCRTVLLCSEFITCLWGSSVMSSSEIRCTANGISYMYRVSAGHLGVTEPYVFQNERYTLTVSATP